jgi:pro-apoptotic serine protease NMA111
MIPSLCIYSSGRRYYPKRLVKQGEDTTFVGYTQDFQVIVAKTTVTDITTVAVPANASAPRYRAINLDAIIVDTRLSSQCSNGVLIGSDGIIQALWLNFLSELTPKAGKDLEYYIRLATPSIRPVISSI